MSVYDFREFFYRFPAFMNCCTIDWFEVSFARSTLSLCGQDLAKRRAICLKYILRSFFRRKFSPIKFAINFFQPWSEETQTLTARKLLYNVECEYDDLQLVVGLCNKIHNIAKKLSGEMNAQFGIDVYFTQKAFTGLIVTFRDLFTKKQK